MQKNLGIQILIDLNNCNQEKLNDMVFIRKIMEEATRRTEATIIKSFFRYFSPHGISGYVMIAESHLAIHTWPEYEYAAVDIFTCGNQISPLKAFEYLRDELEAKSASTQKIKRGIFRDRQQSKK